MIRGREGSERMTDLPLTNERHANKETAEKESDRLSAFTSKAVPLNVTCCVCKKSNVTHHVFTSVARSNASFMQVPHIHERLILASHEVDEKIASK